MVDYAGMTERLGDNASRRVLHEHHRIVRDAVARNGGREIKVQGDGFMVAFGGVAPATDPRLAAVVVIDEPTAGQHRGGEVAAPVYSRIVGGALRLLAVAPDQPVTTPEELPAGPALGNVRTAALR